VGEGGARVGWNEGVRREKAEREADRRILDL